MIIAMTTGSQMDRVLRCPASQALPQVHDANPDDDRDRGTTVHKFLERVAAVGREAALAEVPDDHKALCSDIEVAKLADRLKLSTEVALAYNFRDDTARRLQPLEHRAYEVDPNTEIPLTVDLAGIGADKVFVGDWKGPHAWLPPPHQSMQLGIGALALARLHEATSAEVEFIRIRDDGTHLAWRSGLDFFALEGFAARVADTMQAVELVRATISAGIAPTVTEGPWCRYCRAKRSCPAKVAEIRELVGFGNEPYTLAITDENAATVYRAYHKLRSALSAVEGGLYAYAKVSPIPLGADEDGSLRFFGELRRQGSETLDGAKAHQVLAELYGGDAANKAVTMEVSKARITDAVREHLKPGEKITHKAEEVFAAVRERGGAKRKEVVSTIEYTTAPDGGEVKARKRKAS